jgi:hypothetical protein
VRTLALVALAACGGSSGPSEHVSITAMAGDEPEGGAQVISHTLDGAKLDETTADAVGRAQIGYEPGALVSVVYPGVITDVTADLTILTAPLADGMTLVGPEHDDAPAIIVGGLQMKPKMIQADGFDIQLGCTTVHVTQMPAVVDVGARCMGTDTMLDVLITATQSGTPVGYAVGRVPMADGMAEFDPPSWETDYDSVPVTVMHDGAQVTWALVVDGLPFTSTIGEVPKGLPVDAIVVDADVSQAQHTTRWLPMPPATIDITDADFLPPIETSLAPGYTWTASSLGDAVDLRAAWDTASGAAPAVPSGPFHVTWHAVLPPDASSVAFPPVPLDAPVEPDLALRYVDSSALEGFPALEIDADTIVPPVADGQIRITQAVGLR